MITIERLQEEKLKYQQKQDYFKNLGFDNLVNDFQSIIDLINEMESQCRNHTTYRTK